MLLADTTLVCWTIASSIGFVLRVFGLRSLGETHQHRGRTTGHPLKGIVRVRPPFPPNLLPGHFRICPPLSVPVRLWGSELRIG